MELCYDGVLVMPSSFTQVVSEEMEYLCGGATPSSKTLSQNLVGLFNSCRLAAQALRGSGFSIGYLCGMAKMSYTVIATTVAAKLGVTLATINWVAGIIAFVGTVGVTYYLATHKVFY